MQDESNSSCRKRTGKNSHPRRIEAAICSWVTYGARSRNVRHLLIYCCRVSEALSLQTTDIKGEMLAFRKSTTKGKLKSRIVDIHPDSRETACPVPASQTRGIVPRNAGAYSYIDSVHGRQDFQVCKLSGWVVRFQHSQF